MLDVSKVVSLSKHDDGHMFITFNGADEFNRFFPELRDMLEWWGKEACSKMRNKKLIKEIGSCAKGIHVFRISPSFYDFEPYGGTYHNPPHGYECSVSDLQKAGKEYADMNNKELAEELQKHIHINFGHKEDWGFLWIDKDFLGVIAERLLK